MADKVKLVVSETFASSSEAERKKNIQQAVDQYLRLMLSTGGLDQELLEQEQ